MSGWSIPGIFDLLSFDVAQDRFTICDFELRSFDFLDPSTALRASCAPLGFARDRRDKCAQDKNSKRATTKTRTDTNYGARREHRVYKYMHIY